MQNELNMHTSGGGKEGNSKNKNYYGHHHKDCVFENPKQINKENKLLLSMVKH